MYQNNKNIFPIAAVLATAGIIVGVCGAILIGSDRIGREADVAVGSTGSELEMGSSAAIASDSPPKQVTSSTLSTVLGAHSATVLNVSAPSESPNGSLDSSLIASGSYDNTVKIWSAGDRAGDMRVEVQSLPHSGRVNALAFIPNPDASTAIKHSKSAEQRLVTGSGSGEIKLWDATSGELMTTIADQSGRIMSLAASPDGTFFASGGSNGSIKVWPVEAIAQQQSQTSLRGEVLTGIGPQIDALAFHPIDSNLLISGDHNGTIQVWDLERKEPTLTLTSDSDQIASIAISPDGRYLASGSYDNLIRIWNLETGQLEQTLLGHYKVVADVAFSPDGKVLASSSYDETIKLWNWASASELCTLSGHSGFVYSVAFTDQGTSLVSGGFDGTVRTWDLAAPNNQRCLG